MVKFFMFAQALEVEKEKEEGEDAQQVFKITYVTFVMFKLKMFGLAKILIVPKQAGGEETVVVEVFEYKSVIFHF